MPSGFDRNFNSLYALFATPPNLALNFSGLISTAGNAKSGAYTGGTTTQTTAAAKAAADAKLIPLIRGQLDLANDAALTPPLTPAVSTATTRRIAANDDAILALTRQTLLSNAVGMSSYLNGAVYDDIIALRRDLTAALDAELIRTSGNAALANTASGEQAAALEALRQALADARAAVFADLTSKTRNAARLVTLTPAGVLPAVVVAYDYYEDAARAPELVRRNRVRRPGFVAGPVRVVSR